MSKPLDKLKYHVTGAIERGEKTPITAKVDKHTPKKLGQYTIYPDGRVQSASGWRGLQDNFLVPIPDKWGYPCVRLVIEGVRKKWRVHRLMAELFLSPRPSPNHEIRHLDDNKTNNSIDNLAWGTRKDNADDREKNGRTSRGTSHRNAIKRGIDASKANARLITRRANDA